MGKETKIISWELDFWGYIIFYGKGNENHQLGAGFLGLYNFLWERKRKSSVGS
jgi:hypothetical protein